MGLLIDTSVIVDIERRDASIDAFLDGLKGEDAAISSITASELLVGVSRAVPDERRSRREAFVESVLRQVPVLAVDLSVARTHAQLWGHLGAAGQRISLHDLLIAATALAHGYDILTHNLREFQRVPGLTVRRPDW